MRQNNEKNDGPSLIDTVKTRSLSSFLRTESKMRNIHKPHMQQLVSGVVTTLPCEMLMP